jgi:DNA-binding LacI/PurR family transcriptional regulator
VAVLGFDDIDASGWMEISTINQHLAESGRVAASLLSERIAHRDEPHVVQKINLQVTLVERGTT